MISILAPNNLSWPCCKGRTAFFKIYNDIIIGSRTGKCRRGYFNFSAAAWNHVHQRKTRKVCFCSEVLRGVTRRSQARQLIKHR